MFGTCEAQQPDCQDWDITAAEFEATEQYSPPDVFTGQNCSIDLSPGGFSNEWISPGKSNGWINNCSESNSSNSLIWHWNTNGVYPVNTIVFSTEVSMTISNAYKGAELFYLIRIRPNFQLRQLRLLIRWQDY